MRHLVVFAILLFVSLPVSAQEAPVVGEFSFHYQAFDRRDIVSGDTTTHRFFVQMYSYSQSQKNCGPWGWVYHEVGYTSFVGGPFCDFGSYLSLGVALGSEFFSDSEEGHTLGRFALTASLGNETSSVEYYYENGASGVPWYRADLQLYGNRYIALGGIAQSGDGAGPRLRLSIPLSSSLDLRVWGAKMYNKEEGGALVGIELVRSLR